MNSYLLTFDDTTISREEVLDCLNRLDGVANWLAFMPSVICVVSAYSAHELSVALNMKRPGTRFLIAPFDKYRADGRLPGEVWDFLTNSRPAYVGLLSAQPMGT